MRSNSASEVCTSSPTPSRDPTGKNNLVCSVVKATSTGSETASDPPASASPPNQYTAAGITAKLVWIDAITQRPAMRWRTSRSARRCESVSKRSASSLPRPIVLPSRIPDTDSDSCTRLEMSASVSWVVFAIRRRSLADTPRQQHEQRDQREREQRQLPAQQEHADHRRDDRRHIRRDRGGGVRDHVLDAADVVRDPRLDLAGAGAREEGERQLLEMPEDGRPQVVHDALPDLIGQQRLDHA